MVSADTNHILYWKCNEKSDKMFLSENTESQFLQALSRGNSASLPKVNLHFQIPLFYLKNNKTTPGLSFQITKNLMGNCLYARDNNKIILVIATKQNNLTVLTLVNKYMSVANHAY